jgi:hypothetical protein
MAFRTRITEMLEIEHPIVQGGMQSVGYAELASAVSNAGGLGILTALTQPSPAALREEIERCRAMTDKPFGVNMTVFPTINAPDYVGYAQAIIDGGVKIGGHAGGSRNLGNVAAAWRDHTPQMHRRSPRAVGGAGRVRHHLYRRVRMRGAPRRR